MSEVKPPRSSNSFDKSDLKKAGSGEMFGDSSPRLPSDEMLMIDRIVDITSDGGKYKKGHIIAELDINPDLWFFQCHFKGDPVMPGCLGLDAMWQLLGFFLGWSGHKGKGRALGVGEVKFTGQVLPTASTVTYEIDVKRTIALDLVIAIADGRLSVDGREIYASKALKVGLFQSTDAF